MRKELENTYQYLEGFILGCKHYTGDAIIIEQQQTCLVFRETM